MTFVILHNIRSVHNVGSIFRTADAAGVAKIYLTGHTSTPTDRFGRKRKDFAKVSLGAEKTVPWEQIARVASLLGKLKRDGFRIVAVEQDRRASDYRKIRGAARIALIFGNEVSGVPLSILKKCDCIAEIPMQGSKESLNVGVAAGVVLFSLCVLPPTRNKKVISYVKVR